MDTDRKAFFSLISCLIHPKNVPRDVKLNEDNFEDYLYMDDPTGELEPVTGASRNIANRKQLIQKLKGYVYVCFFVVILMLMCYYLVHSILSYGC